MNAEDYKWYKDHGICTRCLKKPAFRPYTMCPECLEKERTRKSKHTPTSAETMERRNRQRQKRRDNGLCPWCGKPRWGDRVMCAEHTLYYRRKVKKKEPKKQNDGQCRCGRPVKAGFKVCEMHYNKLVEANRCAQNHDSARKAVTALFKLHTAEKSAANG
nr:MAG TPA: restriction endonuclease [Caudoviricetes sp.]